MLESSEHNSLCSTRCAFATVGTILLVGLSLGLGLGLGLRSGSQSRPAWYGCTGRSPYAQDNQSTQWHQTFNVVMDGVGMNLEFTSIGPLVKKSFLAISGNLVGGIQSFLYAVKTTEDVAACRTSNNAYLMYLCNSTRDELVCENIIKMRDAFLTFGYHNISLLMDLTIPNGTIVYDNTNITLGYCAVTGPLIFSDVESNVSGGGTLAQLLTGMFNVTLCD